MCYKLLIMSVYNIVQLFTKSSTITEQRTVVTIVIFNLLVACTLRIYGLLLQMSVQEIHTLFEAKLMWAQGQVKIGKAVLGACILYGTTWQRQHLLPLPRWYSI